MILGLPFNLWAQTTQNDIEPEWKKRIRTVDIWSMPICGYSTMTRDSIKNIQKNREFTFTHIPDFNVAIWNFDYNLDSVFVLLDSIKTNSPVVTENKLENRYFIKMLYHIYSSTRSDTLCFGAVENRGFYNGGMYIYLDGSFYKISIYRFEYLLKLLPYDQYEIFLNGW